MHSRVLSLGPTTEHCRNCRGDVLMWGSVLTHECEGARGAGFSIIPENFFVAWLPIDTISVFW